MLFQEDSEWLEAHEPQDVDLAATGVQELNIDEIAEDESTMDDETHEKPKTWNVASDGTGTAAGSSLICFVPFLLKCYSILFVLASEDGKALDDDEEEVKIPPKQPEAPKKYVAPGARHMLQSRADRQPDLQNVEEFPSLAAADELSKVELEKKKKA